MRAVSDPGDQSRQAFHALSRLLDRIAPWLVEVGTWTFGGLIALNLVVIAALITVGPVDAAILAAVTAFACALPLEVAGMVLLRFGKDVDQVRLEDATLQSFEDAQFSNIRAYFPPPHQRDSVKRRRSRITLGYATAMATLSLALTLTGIVAALWHMAPWVAGVSVATVLLSLGLILLAVLHSMPPESEAERRLKGGSRGMPGPGKRERSQHNMGPR